MINAIRTRLEEKDEGFTLIELLVVVIIIGILAAIAIPVFLNQRERAWNSAAQSDLRNAAVAQETYFTDESTYTEDEDDLADGGFRNSDNVTLTVLGANTEGYCMQAVHAAGGLTWLLDSDIGASVDSDDDDACDGSEY